MESFMVEHFHPGTRWRKRVVVVAVIGKNKRGREERERRKGGKNRRSMYEAGKVRTQEDIPAGNFPDRRLAAGERFHHLQYLWNSFIMCETLL
jgi:hypothetical protein